VAWIGVGWALVSAILFSAAAICLRGEREKEEAMNMQYLMPGKNALTTHNWCTVVMPCFVQDSSNH
jgi:hypothetical protein